MRIALLEHAASLSQINARPAAWASFTNLLGEDHNLVGNSWATHTGASMNWSWQALRPGAKLVVVAACFGLLSGVAVRNLVYFPLRVTSNSMFPTVEKGDWVAISPLEDAPPTEVHRGDIVLFRFPFGGSDLAIKRVIAVPGDWVSNDQNAVRVNDINDVQGSTVQRGEVITPEAAGPTVVVPEGFYYILGDNVASSVDSRSLGLLPQSEILGTVSMIIRMPW